MKILIDNILTEYNYRNNPYFLSLRDGSFSKEDFLETQIQFYFAVIFFSRPMAALAAKIPTPALRLEILRNVWEEHGEGDETRMHGRTFLTLLERLASITPAQVEKKALWPEVRAFNTCLLGACVLDEYLVGVGAMGMIERMFSEISAEIGQAILSRGWLTAEKMIHYNLHEKIDIKHADDFFDVLEASWGESKENRYYIEQGLRLGAEIFYGLYLGLHRSRARRIERVITGPHSRASS